MASQDSTPRHHYERPLWAPGSIQPHGVLLAISQQQTIQYVSANCETHFHQPATELLSQPIATLIPEAGELLAIAPTISYRYYLPHPLTVITPEGPQTYYGAVHYSDELLILELDLIAPDNPPEPSQLNTQLLTRLRQYATLDEFLERLTEVISNFLGFDRTMLYQFTPDGSGAVTSERKAEDATSYLGLHFPASDIPPEAREMYLANTVHVIHTISAPPSPLLSTSLTPENASLSEACEAPRPLEGWIPCPLDLHQSIFRSVDSCCVTFHQNIGVEALCTIALIHNNELWGLIACHNSNSHHVSFPRLNQLECLAQVISSELTNAINRHDSEYKAHLQIQRSTLLSNLARLPQHLDHPIPASPQLLEVVSAQGAAVCLGEQVEMVGETPSSEAIAQLLWWYQKEIDEDFFRTNTLGDHYLPAISDADTASGLLLIRISKGRRYFILWFRPEHPQTVHWAGNPSDNYQTDDDGTITLSPRNSFAKWQEEIRGTAKPWRACELESAASFRNGLVNLVLKQTDQLAKLVQELRRSNSELSSFAYAASHDLKEPLRGIYNFSVFLLEDYADVLDEGGKERLATIVRLSQRMDTLIDALLHYSRVGENALQWTSIDLNQLLTTLIADLKTSERLPAVEMRIAGSLPTINGDPILLQEAFSNLIRNASKYNTSSEPWVEIGWRESAELPTLTWIPEAISGATQCIYVRDNGIGINPNHSASIFRLFKRLHPQAAYGGGTGVGLAIVKKIVEQHRGAIAVESNVNQGSTFYLKLPRS